MNKISNILEDLLVDVNEMPTIGSPLKSSGKVVQVYSSEGKGHPHFHVKLHKRSKIGDACICIKEAKYFHHGLHNGRLSNEELKELVILLKEINTKTPTNMTNWEYLIMMWNNENDDSLDLSLKIPDYESMKRDDVIK